MALIAYKGFVKPVRKKVRVRFFIKPWSRQIKTPPSSVDYIKRGTPEVIELCVTPIRITYVSIILTGGPSNSNNERDDYVKRNLRARMDIRTAVLPYQD